LQDAVESLRMTLADLATGIATRLSPQPAPVASRTALLAGPVTDLQRLRDDLLHQAGTMPTAMTGQQVATLFESFASSVEVALQRCGVRVIAPQPGDRYVPRYHHAAGVYSTDDPRLDGTVAEVLHDGYQEIDTGRALTQAQVRVFRRESATAPGAGAEAGDGPPY
jgi:molecular chaperone GrpE (heat shock protein)